VDIDAADAKELRSALGKAVEVREIEEIRTPDGELDYDTNQRVRHVLLSGGVRLARTPAW
jgi:ADP-ribosylglycohydrolase